MRRPPHLDLTPLDDRLTPGAGDLDPTFGDGGKVVLPLDASFHARATTLTADMRILIAGSSADSFSVARITRDGQLDTTFATGGVATIRFDAYGPGTLATASAVLVRPDGRIVLLGTVSPGPGGPVASTLGLARLNRDGTPDPTFGIAGRATAGFVPTTAGAFAETHRLNAAALLPDGRIVVAGGIQTVTPSGPGGAPVGTSAVAVARFLPDGRLDPAFGSEGRLTASFTPTSNTYSEANAVGLLPDGRVVAVGNADTGGSLQQVVALRLTSDGHFDPTFDDDGRAVVAIPGGQSLAAGLAVHPNGAISIAGSVVGGTYFGFVARLTPAGRLDPTFGGDGVADLPFPSGGFLGSSGAAILLQGDGRVVVAGQHYLTDGNYDLDVAQLESDGGVDATFGAAGLRTVAFDLGGTKAETVGSALLQADGGIVVAGTAYDSGGTKLVALRLLGDRPPLTPRSVLTGGSADGSTLVLEPGAPGLRTGTVAVPLGASAGPVRVVTADVTGDDVPDLIAGAGPGGAPRVMVLDGRTGGLVADFQAFEPTFTGGVYVAAADFDGDGRADVIVSPDVGGGPVVAIFDGARLAAGQGTSAQRNRFLGIEDPDFRGGASAAAGDVNGDGLADLVVSAGFLGGPRVAVFDGVGIGAGTATVRLLPDFFAFEPSLRNGAFVSAADVTGDGTADLAIGAGRGGAPRVRLFDGAKLLATPTATLVDFFAGDDALRGGVHPLLRDGDGDGKADLVTGSGDAEPPRVRLYKSATLLAGDTTADQEFNPFDGMAAPFGVFVG